MKFRVVGLLTASVLLASASSALAQEASVSGTVTDATGAVLPGVTVTAHHLATGNTFVATTDSGGGYRLGVRIGEYKMTAELPGFATAAREGLQFLVGQQATVAFQLSPSTIEENVTVTAAAPLLELTQSSLGGNIDARQLQELPLNGRNWMQLSLMAPGSRVNAGGDSPFGTNPGQFQLNLDGQQITSNIAGATFGQPRFSRDAIAEFELVSSRFDATQGRSSAVQVNAVTKSGTNTFAGTLSGYFRDDAFNAKDFIVNRVLKYSNQQVSGTFGGPLRKDRAHFFVNYEGEREPESFTFTSPFPAFNIPDIQSTRTDKKGAGRFDLQISGNTRLMIRGNGWIENRPYDTCGGAATHPSTCQSREKTSANVLASFTQTIGNKGVNEIRVGWAYFNSDQQPILQGQVPRITLRGYTIGPSGNFPLVLRQNVPSFRNDFSYLLGNHQIKAGGELVDFHIFVSGPRDRNGNIFADAGPVPASIESLFPVWNDPSTWNLDALSPITSRVQQGIGKSDWTSRQKDVAAWFNDYWTVTPSLTINLGLRYDIYFGAYAEDYVLAPFRPDPVPTDKTGFGPRTGFSYAIGQHTVIRGGIGRYFGGLRDQWVQHMVQNTQLTIPQTLNDGRPNFASNPYNGPTPTFEEIISRNVRRDTTTAVTSPDARNPYSWQSAVGFQRQIGNSASVQADYVWIRDRRLEVTRQVNLAYDPITGVNLPFTNVSRLPYPEWGAVTMRFSDGYASYHGLETAFTKRFTSNWQASATYTLSAYKDANPAPINTFAGCTQPVTAAGTCNVPVDTLAPDLGGEYSYAAGDQRHRATFNGIWQLPYGIQLSGLYFFGSGQRFAITYGGDLRQTGSTGAGRLRPDGTVVARNDFVGDPIHRVDLRTLKRLKFGSKVTLDGIFEVFNIFNHKNFGSYVTAESNAAYGRPAQNTAVEFQPRMMQLGFRFAF